MTKPKASLKANFEHGTRAQYVAGCRCTGCTRANLASYHARQELVKEAALALPPSERRDGKYCPGTTDKPCSKKTKVYKSSIAGICRSCRGKLVFNGLVPADKAMEHMLRLSKKGIGYRSVADAAKVGKTLVARIRSGKKATIRAQIEKRILEVDEKAIADHAVIDGTATKKAIQEMIGTGLTKAEIATRLGFATPAIQFRDKVVARTAFRVGRLLVIVRKESQNNKALNETCFDCGFSHKRSTRISVIQKKLRLVDGVRTQEEIRDFRLITPLHCFYEKSNAGYVRLRRDIKDAKSDTLQGRRTL